MEANVPKYDEWVSYWLDGNRLCKITSENQ